MTRAELTTLLWELRRREGSALGLARVLGYKASNHIPALLRDVNPITPEVETCLRIALASDTHPSTILTAAGHGEIVPILERAYSGAAGTATPKDADPGAVACSELELWALAAVRRMQGRVPVELEAWLAAVALRLENLDQERSSSDASTDTAWRRGRRA
jgi:hypothetical protein